MSITKKEALRKHFSKLRKNMNKAEVEHKSGKIHENIYKLSQFKFASNIMLYASFNNEVDTIPLFHHCKQLGKKTYFPKCIPCNKTMKIYEITNFNQMKRTSFGIFEPYGDNLTAIDPKNIDIVVVPGIAFDLEGYRLGFGAGYYDRFLKPISNSCFKLAVAYDFQIAKKLPRNSHDIPVDCIVTESRVISINS